MALISCHGSQNKTFFPQLDVCPPDVKDYKVRVSNQNLEDKTVSRPRPKLKIILAPNLVCRWKVMRTCASKTFTALGQMSLKSNILFSFNFPLNYYGKVWTTAVISLLGFDQCLYLILKIHIHSARSKVIGQKLHKANNFIFLLFLL